MPTRLVDVLIEAEEFFQQVGAHYPDGYDPYDDCPVFKCPVCGSVNDWQGPCSPGCQYAWTHVEDDPRELEAWAREDAMREQFDGDTDDPAYVAREIEAAQEAAEQEDGKHTLGDLPF